MGDEVIVLPAYDVDDPDPPFFDESECDYITVRHPHHSCHRRIVDLPLWDETLASRSNESAPADRGIHYGTLITACTILADNLPGGYLARDREGTDRLIPADTSTDASWDNIVRGVSMCYLHFPGFPLDSPPYRIVGSFDEWIFPHGNLHPRWMVSRLAALHFRRLTTSRCRSLHRRSHDNSEERDPRPCLWQWPIVM
jgi:hypothetical protein